MAVIVFLLLGGFFAYQKIIARSLPEDIPEVDLIFDSEGPYALLLPRRDGNALTLHLKRTGSYDRIKYELTYNAQGTDRGVSGEISTKEKRGEYEQEILFGSCSSGGKCVYDKEVENGTLTLHIRKGKEAFRMITQWHLQKPDLALGILTSGDAHLIYTMNPNTSDLSFLKYTIINDLTGAPKLPDEKEILGKVYALNTPIAKVLPSGLVTIELSENPPQGGQIARFNESENKWVLSETKTNGSKLTASLETGGIITVLIPQTK